MLTCDAGGGGCAVRCGHVHHIWTTDRAVDVLVVAGLPWGLGVGREVDT